MICVRGLFLYLLLGNVNININAQSKIKNIGFKTIYDYYHDWYFQIRLIDSALLIGSNSKADP